jgi:CheY-like chemotaxis protein/kynurenine formamidase/two-component sensor histidine kinase
MFFPYFTSFAICRCGQSAHTKPSYEEEYKADAPMNVRSQYGHGYTFPCLFHVGENGWALISETGVDSKYCGSHLSDATADGLYTIAFPMPEENNGNGTASPGLALPGSTPWRTITVGENLKPIVETTIPWDVVEPLYPTEHTYKMGRGTWSWILWQDGSINFDDQKKYVDLAAAMGYEYVLIDNWWDTNIGRERMKDFIDYAHSKKVDVFLWYSSSGYWNDIVQGPTNYMDNPIIRKKEMKWLHNIGVKGIKVDFFGGDKQETIRLYEAILSDADDHGLMVIFHGCTLPRGWERMYPNYVGSEAVLASENLIFQQHFVERNSKYLLSLVNQLMDFRKVESGKMEIVRNPGNFAKLLNELLVPFDAYASERGITIERRFRLPSCEIMYDEDAMHKVIVNLIGNALKFTPKGGQITIYATPLRQEEQEKLFICIRDTGPGLPEEEIDKVFNRFYQSQNKTHSSINGQSGTGIGLYLCKRIVQLHGGSICAKNNQSKGCSFRILLPLQYADADSLPTPTEQVKEPVDSPMTLQPATNGKLTILVVEDNKDMRDYIRSILTEYYNVLEASQGEEALTVLQSQNVDFIVSDLMMPVMDGMELSRRVKSNFAISHIPFLMLTAKTSNESRIESFRIGVDEYLLKPFDDTLLLARISNILENRKRFQQKFSYSMDVDALNIEKESSDKKFLDKAMQIVKENYKNSYYEISDFIEAMGVSKSLMNKKK